MHGPLLLFVLSLWLRAASGDVNTLRCSTVQTPEWTRTLCFEPEHDVAYAPNEGHANITLSWDLFSDEASKTPACGDTLRVQFVSAKALVAPTGAIAVERAQPCGHYSVLLRFPRLGRRVSYTPEIQVVHINGEGLAEPPGPRLHPNNLVNYNNDGPAVYNQRFGWPHASKLVVKFPAETAHTQDGWSQFRSAQAAPQWPGGKPPAPQLPRCTRGDEPGAWHVHTSMYPDHPGEPWQWRPFDCVWPRASGRAWRSCLDDLDGGVHFFAESTGVQLGDLLQQHAHVQRYHWPTHIARPGDGPYSTFHPHLKYSSRYHGTNMLFANAIPKMQALRHSVAAGRVAAPHAYVFLQGANDAARDVLAAATARVAAFIADLKQGLANGTLAQPTHMVWITSPVRQYTAGGQPTPAQVVCTRPSECRTVQARQYGRDNGEFGWGSEEGGQVEEAFRTFGTLARRRHYNELVAGLWRAAFPNARVLDWEAITAPLPSDYCHDGEHWVTVLEVWRWYRIDPWAGHSMAGAEAANVLVSLLCPALDINTKPPAIGEYERGGR